MANKKIIYPKSLKDIPRWRQRQLEEDLLWFSKFSPAERLRYIDREWEDIQNFINKFGFKKNGTRKKGRLDDLIRLKKIRKPNIKDEQDIEYLLKAKRFLKK